jgi:glucosamine-6-phosphate deaminase
MRSDRSHLQVYRHPTRKVMGEHAASMLAETISKLLRDKETIHIIFAAAPSQNELLASLVTKAIPWERIHAFHMDEYIGLERGAPQTFRHYLDEHLFGLVAFKHVHYLDGHATDIEKECGRYARLLKDHRTDIVCMGIGENGHIAFNDPHVADFEDKDDVKVVDLDDVCRQQQVNDGCFGNLEQVPNQALTLTIPALVRADHIFCVVPGPKKAQAVHNTLNQDVHPDYPSTILRRHKNAHLFLDDDSARLLT